MAPEEAALGGSELRPIRAVSRAAHVPGLCFINAVEAQAEHLHQ